MKKNENDISLLGELIYKAKNAKQRLKSARLPQRLIDRQKRLAGYRGEGSPQEAKLSFALRIARLISIFLLCVTVLGVLLFGKSIITYENVYYMFKDIGYINSFNESRPNTLNFSKPVTNQDFGTFKNGLAVAGDSEIKFFTSTGRVTLSAGSSFTDPHIVCSDSTALIFDRGKTGYSVYNSFIAVHSEVLEFPIVNADMANDGSFCIVTRSADYGSAVRVYNRAYELEMVYYKNDYTVSARLSEDGKMLAVLSLDSSEGESRVSLNILKVGNDKVYSSTQLVGVMPYDVRFLSNDRVAVIGNKSTSVYDIDCDRISLIEYPGRLSYMSFFADEMALVFTKEGQSERSTVSCFDKNGAIKHSSSFNGYITDMALGKGEIFLLCDSRIVKVPIGGMGTYEIPFDGEGARLVTFANGDVMACTQGVAYYISFD